MGVEAELRRYGGGLIDPSGSDLVQFGARLYDPQTRGFASRDPAFFSEPYGFALGNPLVFQDPSGLVSTRGEPLSDLASAAGNWFNRMSQEVSAGVDRIGHAISEVITPGVDVSNSLAHAVHSLDTDRGGPPVGAVWLLGSTIAELTRAPSDIVTLITGVGAHDSRPGDLERIARGGMAMAAVLPLGGEGGAALSVVDESAGGAGGAGGGALGGGSSSAGTATLHRWENGLAGGHWSVEVTWAGRSVHTELEAVGGATRIRLFEPVHPPGPSFMVELPNAQSAMDLQVELLDTFGGAFDSYTNSCMTHCVQVLEAGGVPGPASPTQFPQWFRQTFGASYR